MMKNTDKIMVSKNRKIGLLVIATLLKYVNLSVFGVEKMR